MCGQLLSFFNFYRENGYKKDSDCVRVIAYDFGNDLVIIEKITKRIFFFRKKKKDILTRVA